MAKQNRKVKFFPCEIQLFEDLCNELYGYSVESVADSANVAPSTIYFWLDGTTKKPRLDTIVKVANAIGFDIQLVKRNRKTHLRVIK